MKRTKELSKSTIFFFLLGMVVMFAPDMIFYYKDPVKNSYSAKPENTEESRKHI